MTFYDTNSRPNKKYLIKGNNHFQTKSTGFLGGELNLDAIFDDDDDGGKKKKKGKKKGNLLHCVHFNRLIMNLLVFINRRRIKREETSTYSKGKECGSITRCYRISDE